jgi:hypothetical protein
MKLNLANVKITMKSGILQWLADALIPLFKDTIVGVVNDLACDQLPDLVHDKATDLFGMLNGIVRPFLNETLPRKIPVDVPAMVDMRWSPIIDTGRFLLNSFTGANGTLNFNRLINLLSNNTGNLTLAQFYNETISFTIDIPSMGGSITAGILDLAINDVNTWKEFEVLVPVTPVLLNSHTSLKELGLSIAFFVNVSVDGDMISAGSTWLYEEAILATHMSNNELWLQLQMASFNGVAANYSNNMCTNMTCVADLFSPDSTALTYAKFNMTITELGMHAAGGSLEKELHQVIDKLIQLFIDNYKFMIPPFFNGVVDGLGATYINQMLNDTIRGMFCQYKADEVPVYVAPASTGAAIGAAGGGFVMLALFPFVALFRPKRKYEEEEEEEGGQAASSGAAGKPI